MAPELGIYLSKNTNSNNDTEYILTEIKFDGQVFSSGLDSILGAGDFDWPVAIYLKEEGDNEPYEKKKEITVSQASDNFDVRPIG